MEIATDYERAYFGTSKGHLKEKVKKSKPPNPNPVQKVNTFKRPPEHREVECYKCRKIGHYARDCKVKMNEKTTIERRENPSRDQKKAKGDAKVNEINVIDEVGMADIKVEDDQIKSNQSKCFTITGKINNRDAKLLIDTGANGNHIRPAYLKKLKVEPFNTDKMFKVTL